MLFINNWNNIFRDFSSQGRKMRFHGLRSDRSARADRFAGPNVARSHEGVKSYDRVTNIIFLYIAHRIRFYEYFYKK